MKEILFRGKVTDIPLYRQDKTKIGTWVYGSYVSYPVPQIFNLEDEYVVYRRTVGQYTGLCDKNGVKIFEGDICKDRFGDFIVKWDIECARFLGFYLPIVKRDTRICYVGGVPPVEVIGNIHDTPEWIATH